MKTTTPFEGYNAKIRDKKVRVVNRLVKSTGEILLKVRARIKMYPYGGSGHKLGEAYWVLESIVTK
jgi:hypothetical protein